MEFTIKKSSKDSLVQFVEWIKDRAKDPLHENNKDIIADFLEKVVVVELKKLENDPTEFDSKIDIPDDLIPRQGPDANTLIRKVVGVLVEEMMDKDGNPLDLNEILNLDSTKEVEDKSTTVEDEESAEPLGEVLTGKEEKGSIRTGNNHKKGKKRPLNDCERTYITQVFLSKNGVLADKDCTEIAKHLGISAEGKTPWQVTGLVSELCRQVNEGKLKLTKPATAPTFVANPLKKKLK